MVSWERVGVEKGGGASVGGAKVGEAKVGEAKVGAAKVGEAKVGEAKVGLNTSGSIQPEEMRGQNFFKFVGFHQAASVWLLRILTSDRLSTLSGVARLSRKLIVWRDGFLILRHADFVTSIFICFVSFVLMLLRVD
jgi:hypothetical protein